MLERLYTLSAGGDARAVADCYAERIRSGPTFADVAARWSTSGPATGLVIRFLDRVKECDRFAVNAELAHGETVAHFGNQTIFYSVGLEQGVPRIYDGGTGLTAAEVTLVACG